MVTSKFKCVLALILTVATTALQAAEISVQKGDQVTVACSATAPQGGWITHSFYSLADQEDSRYLGISYASSDCQVTYYGLAPKSRIKVEVTYAYSYRGTYDNNIHVGSASYYDYVTVTGAPDAKSFTIREGDYFTIRPGQKLDLHCEFYPKGSEAEVEWGIIQGISTYGCVDLDVKDNGASCTVTANKKGTSYIAAMFPGDSKSAQPVTIKVEENAEVEIPEAIVFEQDELSLMEGETYVLTPTFQPENSYSELVWESKNENVCTVNNGKIKAVGEGETEIVATAEEGNARATLKVKVTAAATDFEVPSSIDVQLGYSYKASVTFYPKNSSDTLSWQSSDTNVASVSANGVIKARRLGTATVKVKSKTTGEEKEIRVNVTAPSKGMDANNVKIKVQNFKGIVNRTILNK